MAEHVSAAVLGVVALVFFVAERCISCFTWSHLEGLTSIPRARRQAVEDCLEERDLVATCFSVVGTVALVALAAIFGTIYAREQPFWPSVAEAAGGAVLLAWIVPELAAWTIRKWVVLYVVPLLYRVVGAPFRAVRMISGQSPGPAQENGLVEGETPGETPGSDAEAHEFFKEAVRLQHTPVREIMTPRTDMVSIADTATLQAAAKVCEESGHSRFPVYRSNRDQITGVVHAKDLLAHAETKEWHQPALKALMRPPYYVPETKTISELLEEFQLSNTHMAVVLDEYGGTSGLVTMEDVLEELIGEIHDEHENITEEEPLFKKIDNTHVEVQATMRVEEFNDAFDFDMLSQEDFDTVGGFVTFIMGKIPVTGESFHYSRARFAVLQADARHVVRVSVAFDEALEGVPDAGEKG